ncbi:MAG: sortase [Candidatus Shapirobacteria bacterium]
MKFRLSVFLFIFGLVFFIFGVYLFIQRITSKPLNLNLNSSLQDEKDIGGLEPKLLLIKDLGIELPIFPAQITKEKWEDPSSWGVSYISASPVPGEPGNSILYGHNWSNLLGKLVNIKPGQELEVVFNDESVRRFSVRTTQIVSTGTTSILESSDDKRITLYTCVGFLEKKRFVVTAVLVI